MESSTSRLDLVGFEPFTGPSLEELLPQLSREERLRLQSHLREHERKVKRWSNKCPPLPSTHSEGYVPSAWNRHPCCRGFWQLQVRTSSYIIKLLIESSITVRYCLGAAYLKSRIWTKLCSSYLQYKVCMFNHLMHTWVLLTDESDT